MTHSPTQINLGMVRGQNAIQGLHKIDDNGSSLPPKFLGHLCLERGLEWLAVDWQERGR